MTLPDEDSPVTVPGEDVPITLPSKDGSVTVPSEDGPVVVDHVHPSHEGELLRLARIFVKESSCNTEWGQP